MERSLVNEWMIEWPKRHRQMSKGSKRCRQINPIFGFNLNHPLYVNSIKRQQKQNEFWLAFHGDKLSSLPGFFFKVNKMVINVC